MSNSSSPPEWPPPSAPPEPPSPFAYDAYFGVQQFVTDENLKNAAIINAVFFGIFFISFVLLQKASVLYKFRLVGRAEGRGKERRRREERGGKRKGTHKLGSCPACGADPRTPMHACRCPPVSPSGHRRCRWA
jgi:hypothetical protein